MTDQKTGLEKARETAEKLKAENAQEVAKKEEAAQEAMNALATVSQNAELAKMYNESVQVGAKNLTSEVPLLKVHQTGKSTKNELPDGSEPNDGWFFYKPTGEQFQAVTAHILTISEGFRAPGLTRPGEDAKEIFNQIVGGVIVAEGDYKPFIMYFTGKKLSYLWEFGKEVSKYTRQKPVGIPMFALTVKMTTEKVTNDFGKSWIVNFAIEKMEDGSPALVTDSGLFQFLKSHVEMVEDTIASLIAAKVTKEDEAQPVQVSGQSVDADPHADAEDIPF